MKIYVASSWRNEFQPEIVFRLREAGHEVYDFRNPPNKSGGFQWTQVDVNWEKWTAREYRDNLTNSARCAGAFLSDLRAMNWADACVYVLPCGRSASLELGYMAGRGKRTVVLLTGDERPDLMFLAADHICLDMKECLDALGPYEVIPRAHPAVININNVSVDNGADN